MARTARFHRLQPRREDPRPRPLVQSSSSYQHSDEHEPTQACFTMECNSLSLWEPYPGDGQLVLIPDQWSSKIEWDPSMEVTGEWRDIQGVPYVWKTTHIYEQLTPSSSTLANNESTTVHPNLLKSLGSDPWTRFPLFEKPVGAISLVDFTRIFRAQFYSPSSSGESRVLTAYLPVVYQWVLHLVFAIAFLHTNDIMLGELNEESCLLATSSTNSSSAVGVTTMVPSDTQPIPTRLFLVGFRDAVYPSRSHGGQKISGAEFPCRDFSTPLGTDKEPTRATDMFLLGNLVYALMTGCSSWEVMLPRNQDAEGSPLNLEREYLGDIVKKCWAGDYGEETKTLKSDLLQFLASQGLLNGDPGGDDNDDLLGVLNVEGLHLNPTEIR